MALPFFGLGTTTLLNPWEVFSKHLPINLLGTGGGEKVIQKAPQQKVKFIPRPEDPYKTIDGAFFKPLDPPKPHWTHLDQLDRLWEETGSNQPTQEQMNNYLSRFEKTAPKRQVTFFSPS